MRVWNVEGRKCYKVLHDAAEVLSCFLTLKIYCCTFSKNDELVVSGGSDNTLKVWNVEQGNCIKTLKGHTNTVLHFHSMY